MCLWHASLILGAGEGNGYCVLMTVSHFLYSSLTFLIFYSVATNKTNEMNHILCPISAVFWKSSHPFSLSDSSCFLLWMTLILLMPLILRVRLP